MIWGYHTIGWQQELFDITPAIRWVQASNHWKLVWALTHASVPNNDVLYTNFVEMWSTRSVLIQNKSVNQLTWLRLLSDVHFVSKSPNCMHGCLCQKKFDYWFQTNDVKSMGWWFVWNQNSRAALVIECHHFTSEFKHIHVHTRICQFNFQTFIWVQLASLSFHWLITSKSVRSMQMKKRWCTCKL